MSDPDIVIAKEEEPTIAALTVRLEAAIKQKKVYEVKQFGGTLNWTNSYIEAMTTFDNLHRTGQVYEIYGCFKRLIKEKF